MNYWVSCLTMMQLMETLISQFANIHDFTGNQQGLEKFVHSWILRDSDKGWCLLTKSVKRCQWDICNFLETLKSAATALLVTRTERCALQQTIIFNRRFHSPDSIMGTLAPSFIPPQQQNAPLASRYTFLYYFELIINKYAWLMLIIILCNILFCYLFFCEDGWEVNFIT